ncbi:MAG: peptidylprolyl isomerase [Candidatus Methylacidiphilales bacterium]
MKKIASLTLTFLALSITNQTFAQKGKKAQAPTVKLAPVAKPNPIVFIYGTDTVYQNEFERLLYKNKTSKDKLSEKEVREYLDLYINFKLKVKEAKVLKLDTNNNFVTELAGYRKQLSNPYLTDKKVSESLMQEAYQRMKTEINGSHILLFCNENASPADTLAAYNKLLDIRKRASKGENFDSLASKFSEDPSAKKMGAKLGWFTVFQMVYPFENQSYKTAKGEISMPFRTQFGYHILKVNDKRTARGEVKLAHIMIRTQYDAAPEQIQDAQNKVDSIYDQIKKGGNFGSLAEMFSQDEASSKNKGEMNWVASLSGYPDEFKDIAFGLNKDEVSKPFKTNFGFHIVKLIDKRPLGEFKDVQDVIKQKTNKDSRSESSKAAVIARVKKENNYKENMATLKSFTATIDSNFINATWNYDEEKVSTNNLFTIGTARFTVKDFAAYLKANQQPLEKASVQMAAQHMFRTWADEKCLAYEESILDTKYEDFRNVMQEYNDGILLFDLTDKKVWSKAVSDTIGLEKFYETNKNSYRWKDRVSYNIYTCLNEKTKAEAVKMFSKGKTETEIFAKLNKKIAGTISSKEVKSERSDATADKLWDKKGVVDIANAEGSFKFYFVQGVVNSEVKTLKEAKGIATSEYQNQLEKDWIKELRAKYNIVINEETVKGLF